MHINTQRRSADRRDAEEGIASITHESEAVDYLEGLVEVVQERMELIRNHGGSSWLHLPRDVANEQYVHPGVIVIEEYDSTIATSDIPLSIDPYGEVQEYNDNVIRIKELVLKLIEDEDTGRAGLHFVLVSHRKKHEQAVFDNYILLPYPNENFDHESYDKVFHKSGDREVAKRLTEELSRMPSEKPYKPAILVSRVGEVQGSSFRHPN